MGDKKKRSLAGLLDYINLKGADAVEGEVGHGQLRIERPTRPPKPKSWRERHDDELINQLVELEESGLPVPPGWALLRHHNPEDLPDINSPVYDEYVERRDRLEKEERLKKGVPSRKK